MRRRERGQRTHRAHDGFFVHEPNWRSSCSRLPSAMPRGDLDSTTACNAVRSAGGSIATAARALRITQSELIQLLRDDPPMRLGLEKNKTSGLRRRVCTSANDEDPESA